MIVSASYAKRLIRQGRANNGGTLKPDERGRVYVILNRADIHRTDHYLS
jgi:hypothetical protein